MSTNEHIVYTSKQWNSVHIKSYIPDEGSLLIEVCDDYTIKIKLGDGRLPFHKLQYVADSSLYYTKIQTDEMFGDVREELKKYAQIAYVDKQDTGLQTQIDALKKDSHTHTNKEILDKTTESFTTAYKNRLDSLSDYDDSGIKSRLSAVEQKAHSHSNQSILDATTASFTKEDKSKLDGLSGTVDLSSVEQKISKLENASHTHSNQSILDKTTASFTKDYETKINQIETYSIFKGSNETQAGVKGLVPAPAAGEQEYYLRGDGVWAPVSGGGGSVTLVPATATTLGGVKIGNNINVTSEGVISVTFPTVESYTLPIATSSRLGGVKIGSGMSVESDGTISVAPTKIPDLVSGDGVQIEYGTGDDVTLPSGYTRVTYAEKRDSENRGLVVNTHQLVTPDIRVECDVDISDQIVDTYQALFGTKESDWYNTFILFTRFNGNNQPCFATPAGGERTGTGLIYNARIQIIATQSQISWYQNGTLINYIDGSGNWSYDKSIILYGCALKGVIQPGGYAKVYRFKVYHGASLDCDMIPCIQDATNTVGFYDVINNIFIDSSELSSGTKLVAGDVFEEKNIISVVPATKTSIGGVKVGDGLSITNDGVLSADIQENGVLSVTQDAMNLNTLHVEYSDSTNDITLPTYELPIASSSALGGVKIGRNIEVAADGTISTAKAPTYSAGNGISFKTSNGSHGLPTGYKEIEYIELADTTQRPYFDLGYYAKPSTSIELTMMQTGGTPFRGVFGTRADSGGVNHAYLVATYGNDGLSFNRADHNYQYGGYTATLSKSIMNEKITIVTDRGACSVYDEEMSLLGTAVSPDTMTTDTNQTCLLFSARASNNGYDHVDYTSGRIYELIIYENDSIVHHYIPCIAGTILGLYDLVDQTFLQPAAGASNVSAGPATSDDTGTQITINVTPATNESIGGVKIGDGLSIDNDGVLSADVQEGYSSGTGITVLNTDSDYPTRRIMNDGVLDVTPVDDNSVAALTVEKRNGDTEIDLIALLQGLTINVNFSDGGGSTYNSTSAVIDAHASEKANLMGMDGENYVIDAHASEKANLMGMDGENYVIDAHATIPE